MGMKRRPARPLTPAQTKKALREVSLSELYDAAKERGLIPDVTPFAHWNALSDVHKTMVVDVLTEQAAKYRLAQSMHREFEHAPSLMRVGDVAGALRAARLTLETIERIATEKQYMRGCSVDRGTAPGR